MRGQGTAQSSTIGSSRERAAEGMQKPLRNITSACPHRLPGSARSRCRTAALQHAMKRTMAGSGLCLQGKMSWPEEKLPHKHECPRIPRE